MFYPITSVDELCDGYIKAFELEDFHVLLIQFDGNIYLIENKCGHFGVELENGSLRIDKAIPCIVCPEHGISFSLTSGEVVNRPYENCSAIRLFEYEVRENVLGLIGN